MKTDVFWLHYYCDEWGKPYICSTAGSNYYPRKNFVKQLELVRMDIDQEIFEAFVSTIKDIYHLEYLADLMSQYKIVK